MSWDLLVVGGGPGGYVSAIRAAVGNIFFSAPRNGTVATIPRANFDGHLIDKHISSKEKHLERPAAERGAVGIIAFRLRQAYARASTG